MRHIAEDCIDRHSPPVVMIWTSDLRQLGARNFHSLDSLLRTTPCAEITILSPREENFSIFSKYQLAGYNLRHLSIEVLISAVCDAEVGGGREMEVVRLESPGCAWFRTQSVERNRGEFYHVHLSDMLRMLYLHTFGGSYMDFDHILLRPIFSKDFFGKQVLGTEVCERDNPDCLSLDEAKALKVIQRESFGDGEQTTRQFFPAQGETSDRRYTPCNGVMINFVPGHWLLKESLQHADSQYDRKCWGCLGPRLFGKVLKRRHLMGQLGEVTLVPPGVIYAFDYHLAPKAMREVLVPSPDFNLNATGMHLYGKVTSKVDIVEPSNIFHILQPLSSFGVMHPIFETSPASRCKPKPKWSGVAGTFPSDPSLLLALLRNQDIPSVLVCHPEWLGIREATIKIAVNTQLPIIFARSLHSSGEIHRTLKALGVLRVFIQGIVPDSDYFVRKFYRRFHIYLTYHSGFGVHNTEEIEAFSLFSMMKLSEAHKVSVNFLEEDQSNSWRELGFEQVQTVTHAFQSMVLVQPRAFSRLARIGMLGTSTRMSVKNFWPQISAACMIEGAEVHINVDSERFAGLKSYTAVSRCKGKLVNHKNLGPDIFLSLLRTMDVNLYVTITDALPNVVLDSLAAGIPAVSSDVSDIFARSSLLREKLVEKRIDDPIAIRDKILEAWSFRTESPEMFLSETKKCLMDLDIASRSQWSDLILDSRR